MHPSKSDLLYKPLICFSHLRWDFVYQRPQHLMSRMSRRQPVLYWEEPVPTDGPPYLEIREITPNLRVVVPRLPEAESAPGHCAGEARQGLMLDALLEEQGISEPVLWYYTPMALAIGAHLPASLIVYDCMDELSNFQNPPEGLVARERSLLNRADLVFTGGRSLYEAKRHLHPNVHAFPSSVDVPHFAQARQMPPDADEMPGVPHPRIGFHGVVDERLDLGLLDAAARTRPDWQWVLVGPVVKIDPVSLPTLDNIHWLGGRRYEELPRHLGRWDVAMMPFALNASTRFISPTKTPEYLAGGCPVVSTPIADVVHTYGGTGVVRIARGAAAFVESIGDLLDRGAPARSAEFCARADAVLNGMSWDRTCREMSTLMANTWHARQGRPHLSVPAGAFQPNSSIEARA